MKSKAFSIAILLVILAALYATNPSQDDFSKYLKQSTEKNTGGAIGKLAGGVASLAASAYHRDNYYLFSLYYIKAGDKKAGLHLGVLKSFVKLDK
ncbi:hypothetical protein MASR2M29_00800 [Spirochaetota bacterium]